MLNSGIYKLTHIDTGKNYIGQSKKLNVRLNAHKNCEFKDVTKGSQSVIRRAIHKYGFNSFNYKVLIYCNPGEFMDLMETKLIKQYNSFVPNGYNISSGGNSVSISEEGKLRISKANTGRIFTQEQKEKLSNSLKEFNVKFGRSDEWRKNLSIGNKGKKKSDTHREKLSKYRIEFIKLNPNSVKNMLGKKHSEKTKKLMSEKHLGFKHTKESIDKMKQKAKNRIKVMLPNGSWTWGKK